MLPLDRTSPLPLYAQLKQRLIGLIARSERGDGRFCTDEELSDLFGVSRDTARQAVAELVADGLLRRARGRGTFIVFPPVEERFNPGMDFAHQWAARGTPMQIVGLVFARQAADAALADLLDVEPGRLVLFIKRVRSAARVPIALDFRYIPDDLVPDWDESCIAQSFLHLLWQRHRLAGGEFAITAGLAGADERAHLHLPSGAPVLIRHLSYQDAAGRRVLAGHTVHRADLARYAIQVPLADAHRPRPEQPAVPAGLHGMIDIQGD